MWFAVAAVQNERDRISVRRTTYDDIGQNGSTLSVHTLVNAELMSRQVRLLRSANDQIHVCPKSITHVSP